MKNNYSRKLLFILLIFGIGSTAFGQINITSTVPPPFIYQQNFDTYAGTSASTGITGWTVSNTKASYKGQGNGSSNAGGAWSYGSGSDWSLGGLNSGNGGLTTYSVTFKNTTGTTITGLKISYDLEGWRNGGGNAGGIAVSVSGLPASTATSLSNGYPAGSVAKTANLAGLAIADNATFTISWVNIDLAGSDNGVSVDNFKLEATYTLTAPEITPSVSMLASFGDVMIGNPSASQSFTFDGEGLTDDVSIAAPAGFQISTDNSNWYPGTDMSPGSGGNLENIQIWVRFDPSVVGAASGSVVISSPGADDKSISVSGTGIPALKLEILPAVVNSLVYPENGGPSPAFQFTKLTTIGLDPSSGDINLALATGAASNYEISVDGITWGPSTAFPYTSADNNITDPSVFVRLKAGIAEGALPSDIMTIVGGGLSTSVIVDGTVDPASTITAVDASYGPFCNVAANTFDVAFTPVGTFTGQQFYAQLSGPDGVFADTASNSVGSSAASPITVTIPAGTAPGTNYRVRVYNETPLTFSTGDNGHPIVISDSPTFTAIAQAAAVCNGDDASFNLTGLLPGSTSAITCQIDGGSPQTINGVVADAAGNATFILTLSDEDNNAALTVNTIERTDITPSCIIMPATSNTVVLAVNPTPALTGVTSTIVCGDGEATTLHLTGLLPDTTSEISYTIAGGETQAASNIISGADGQADVTVPLQLVNEGQLLEITEIKRTDVLPACPLAITGVNTLLHINARPTAVISGDQTICFGSVSDNISIELTGTAPWNITYTDGTTVAVANNVIVSPYVFTASLLGSKTFTVASVTDANCAAIASGISGSATVTITTASTGGSITGSTSSACPDMNSGELHLISNTGNVIKWQSSAVIDFSAEVTDIANTTSVLEYNNLAEATYYRAVVANGACPESYSATAAITLIQKTVPNFAAIPAFCSGTTPPSLMVISPNGITGTWSPATIDPAQSGTYTFTPDLGQCADTQVLTVTVIEKTIPDFTQIPALCAGTVPPVLSIVSPNGIIGSWSPSVIDNTQDGDYVFTPLANECAVSQTLSITVNLLAEAPAGQETQDFTSGETLSDFDVAGDNLTWYDAPVGGNELQPSELIVTGGIYYVSQNPSGCESALRLKIIAGENLGTAAFTAKKFHYYPNPFAETLSIDYDDTIDSVAVFNILGQQMLVQKPDTNNVRLDMSKLAAGTYIINVTSGRASKTFRAIKK